MPEYATERYQALIRKHEDLVAVGRASVPEAVVRARQDVLLTMTLDAKAAMHARGIPLGDFSDMFNELLAQLDQVTSKTSLRAA